MGIKVSCPHCDESYTVPDAKEGRTVRCRNCDEKIVVGESHRSALDGDDDRPPRKSSPRSCRDDDEDDRPRRRAKKAGVPLWAWLAGGGGLLLIIVLVLVVALGRKGNKGGQGPDKGGAGANKDRGGGIPAMGTLTEWNFRKLKYGMTDTEVERIFGPPNSRTIPGGDYLADWGVPQKTQLVVGFHEHKLVEAHMASGNRSIGELELRLPP